MENSVPMIFLPNHPTQKEWGNIAKATNGGIVLTGTATMGQLGTTIGHIDFGEAQDSYFFRLSLPGVQRDPCTFHCVFNANGEVLVHGLNRTGQEIIVRHGVTFIMQTQNFCPVGPISISFKLPGRINAKGFLGNFGRDGILEGIVMKEGMSRENRV